MIYDHVYMYWWSSKYTVISYSWSIYLNLKPYLFETIFQKHIKITFELASNKCYVSESKNY